MVDGLCDHTDFIGSAIEGFQFPVCGKLQSAQTADGTFNHHQFPAFAVQNQQRDEDNHDCHNGT